MIKERGRQDTKIKNSLSVGIVRQTEKHEVEIYIFQKKYVPPSLFFSSVSNSK
jgi:hypothetical protein